MQHMVKTISAKSAMLCHSSLKRFQCKVKYKCSILPCSIQNIQEQCTSYNNIVPCEVDLMTFSETAVTAEYILHYIIPVTIWPFNFHHNFTTALT